MEETWSELVRQRAEERREDIIGPGSCPILRGPDEARKRATGTTRKGRPGRRNQTLGAGNGSGAAEARSREDVRRIEADRDVGGGDAAATGRETLEEEKVMRATGPSGS
jgi:hypothetical protein